MSELKVRLENFMAVRTAELESKNQIVLLVAPNRAGKTQILLLIYSILWSIWRSRKEKSRGMQKFLQQKLKNTLLLKKVNDAITWNKGKSKVEFQVGESKFNLQITEKKIKFEESVSEKEGLSVRNPVYIQPAGLGDYYKGIFSLKKYYPHWKLISEAVTDLITDLLVVADEKASDSEETERLTHEFERLFKAKFFIQNERIFVQEKRRKYGIERTASGLKSLSWLYLTVRYGLLEEFLFLDEPEVNLHPEYIDKLVKFIVEASEGRKIFISTHSDYLLESMNKYILKRGLKVDVWTGYLTEDGAVFESQEADRNHLIDTTPLNETYRQIVKELFEYEEDIEL